MTKRKKIVVSKQTLPLIKAHANAFPVEIYGWLLGYEEKDNLNILSAISCEKYTHQSLLTAEPDPTELLGLASSLPFGINIVGIYHSHLGDVFHSHIDDATMINFGRIYPNAVSIVTNGSELEMFQYTDKRGSMEETTYLEKKLSSPKNHSLEILLDVVLKVPDTKNVNVFSAKMVSSLLRKSLEKAEFRQKGRNVLKEKGRKLDSSIITTQMDIPSELGEEKAPSAYSLSLKTQIEFHLNENETLETIKSQLINAIIEDVSQQIIKGTISGTQLVLGRTIKIPYFSIPLKFHLTPDELAGEASSFIKGFKARAELLQSIGNKKVFEKLIDSLKEYSIIDQ